MAAATGIPLVNGGRRTDGNSTSLLCPGTIWFQNNPNCLINFQTIIEFIRVYFMPPFVFIFDNSDTHFAHTEAPGEGGGSLDTLRVQVSNSILHGGLKIGYTSLISLLFRLI